MDLFAYIEALTVPSPHYADVASVYFTARLIIANTPDKRDFGTTLRESASLHSTLAIYRKIIPQKLGDEYLDLWCSLCTCLCQKGFDTDVRSFFDSSAPNLILNWSEFTRYFNADTGRFLVALCLILADTPNDSLHFAESWLEERFLLSESLYRRISLNFDTYLQCWKAVHLIDLASSTHLPSNSILEAKKFYHLRQLPMTDLLEDYALFFSESETERRIATRGVRKKNRSTLLAESGKTYDDQKLVFLLHALACQPATDVIRGLFYPPGRNDAGFECTVLLKQFFSRVSLLDSVLIVNPSPDMIIACNKLIHFCASIGFAVTDHTVAQLYTREFENLHFCSLDNFGHDKSYNCILITPRDLSVEAILTPIKHFLPGSYIMGLFPETALRDTYSLLEKEGVHIQSAVSIPTQATQSSPRRKVLIEASATWSKSYFMLQQGICDHYQTLFGVNKSHYLVPHQWICTQMTLADMRKAMLQRPACKQLQKPMTIQYTKEIPLLLTLQHNCKGRVAGRVHYCRILRQEDKHRKRGNRLTPIIEKGLRHHTVSQVIDATEIVALDDRIAPYIVEDILDFYSGRLHELSLKTAWFTLRKNLQSTYSYNEELVKNLLSDCTELSDLAIGTSRPNDYDAALASIFPELETIPQKYWTQIFLILNAAKAAGYIKENPLSGHMATVSTRLTKRQQEVRNALTKKTFEFDEETALFGKYLTCNNITTWVHDPFVLALLIALFAVPNIREAVALTWGDFVSNLSLSTFHFNVFHFYANDGTIRPLACSSPHRRRAVPVAPILATIMTRVKKTLMATYDLDEDELSLCPIILQNYDVLKKGITKAKPCDPKLVADRIKAAIDQLGIPTNTVLLPEGGQTDLNIYHGNMLLTHLRYRLRHTCMLTEGELSYMLGTKPPEIFSMHYCAYAHPLIQHRMCCKLNRWLSSFLNTNDINTVFYEETIVEDPHVLRISAEGNLLPYADIHITALDSTDLSDATILIASKHGVDGTIVSFT